MLARILFPHKNYHGNLLWAKKNLHGHEAALSQSLDGLRKLEYWASNYPEGDGVTFSAPSGHDDEQILRDFVNLFPWLLVEKGKLGDSNLELAELEELANGNSDIECIIMVPLERVHLETTFYIGPYKFVCAKGFQSAGDERLADHSGPYIQFNTFLKYSDLLRAGSSVKGDDLVINKCLSIAEHVMDVIRLEFSSFVKPEFTPNPAGQLDSGFYAVEIIPMGISHLKAMNLGGISRPMSASNNWLGPEIREVFFNARDYLTEILNGRADELALGVKSALRGCRQSFYSQGDESRFLNLVFTLDGLARPQKNWRHWTQRIYLAALFSKGDIDTFANELKHYDALYEIRNALVHNGKDFYEMALSPTQSSQDLYDYIYAVIQLIADRNFTTLSELHILAQSLLSQPTWRSRYQSEITAICSAKGIVVQNMPNW